jgi:hypothetical protein
MNTNSVDTVSARPTIVIEIEAAFRRKYRVELRAAARWTEANGWRFRTEDFEDVLAGWVRLTESDRVELRAFRDRMIDERAA